MENYSLSSINQYSPQTMYKSYFHEYVFACSFFEIERTFTKNDSRIIQKIETLPTTEQPIDNESI